MCLAPITIRNRTKTYIPGVTPQYVQVPCNKCQECISMMQQAWSMRCARMIEKYNKLGGCNLFLTFTYSPKCLPLFLPNEGLVHGEYSHPSGIPVFDKSDIDTFFDSFRKHLKRYDNIEDVKYIIACEYGQDPRHRRRAHYHTIIHIPEKLDEKYLLKLINNLWHYGKVLVSPDYGLFVQYDFAGKYVSKYLTKDLNYFQNPKVKNYLFDENGNIIDEHYTKIKPYLSKHWQSQGYGADIIDDILSYDYDEIKRTFVKGYYDAHESLRKRKEIRNPLPLYIYNKLVYDYHKNGTRTISDFGHQILRDTFLDKLNNKVENFYQQISVENLSLLSEEDFSQLINKFRLPVHNIVELHNYLNDNIIPIILYLFESTCSCRHISELNKYMEFNSVDELVNFLVSLKMSQLDTLSTFSANPDSVEHCFDPDGYFTNHDIPITRNPVLENHVSIWPQIIQFIHTSIQTTIHKRRLEEYQKRQETKNRFRYA